MSNALAIAASTLTLRNLLSEVATADYSGLPNDARPVNQIEITTLPPDQARVAEAARSRVNLFLYRTELSAHWRNMDLPRGVRPGEAAPPLMPLDLHYLLTVYAEGDNELIGQVLLGASMRILHDNPLLGRNALNAALAASELGEQIERVRITAAPLSLEELSKLWAGFQSQFRLSAGYQVGVLLVEGERPGRAALPVLRRGRSARGPTVLAAPAPQLLELAFEDPALPFPADIRKPAAELGDVIVVTGTGFADEEMVVRLLHDSREVTRTLTLAPEQDATTVRVRLPDVSEPEVPQGWRPGFWRLELEVARPSTPNWTTNRLAFPLAPTVTSVGPASQPEAAQPFTLTLGCMPQIATGQRVSVLLGARAFAPESVSTPADPQAASKVEVEVAGLAPGRYVVRLRVDGVDSLPVDFAADPPAFDPAQVVEVIR